jgi:hypothetical protein
MRDAHGLSGILSPAVRLLTTATVAAIVLVAPSAALAGNGGNCSACQVYVEQVPTASGPKTGGSATSPGPSVPPAHKAQQKPNTAGGGNAPSFGRKLESSGPVSSPGPVAAAFDLGVGPTTLLALVLGSVLGFAGWAGFNGWRRRRTRPASHPD